MSAGAASLAQYQGDRRHDGDGDSMVTITLSSGTTGVPKGSVTTHRQYFERMRAYVELYADTGAFSIERPANALLAASIAFSTFFRRMISHLFIGGTIIILPDHLHTIDLVKAIGGWDDAFCFVTSAMCRFMLSCAPQQGVLLPRLRVLVGGGSLLYPEEKLAMLARVTPNFYDHYGASGFGTVAVLSPADMARRPESVGRPASMAEIEVVDEAGRALPQGSVGRLRCRGTAGKGFAAEVDPAGDERFRDGWYYPGDLAYLDDAGYLFLKGRAAAVISRGGAELFAADIEGIIAEHPAVREVAVVGVPRPGRGEDIVALIVPRGQPQHEAVAAHCKMRLPRDRWPDRVFYAQVLPKTAGGKLDRVRVKALVIEQSGPGPGAVPAG